MHYTPPLPGDIGCPARLVLQHGAHLGSTAQQRAPIIDVHHVVQTFYAVVNGGQVGTHDAHTVHGVV